MVAVGIALMYLGYGLGLWGYVGVKGYNLKASEIWSPTAYYKGQWPPPTNIPTDQIEP